MTDYIDGFLILLLIAIFIGVPALRGETSALVCYSDIHSVPHPSMMRVATRVLPAIKPGHCRQNNYSIASPVSIGRYHALGQLASTQSRANERTFNYNAATTDVG